MLFKQADQTPVFTASDGCLLSEVIHPAQDGTAPGVSLARASIPPHGSTNPHRLDFLEVYYFLTGQGTMHVDDQAMGVHTDSCVYLAPGQVQWVDNPGPEPLVFLCLCHPAYDPEGDHPA